MGSQLLIQFLIGAKKGVYVDWNESPIEDPYAMKALMQAVRLPARAIGWAVSRPLALLKHARQAQVPPARTPYGNAVPALKHENLSLTQLKPGRLVFVGDCHGTSSCVQQNV